MRTQSKNRKATKSMGKCSFSCHLLSLPSNWYTVFFSCIIEIMVIFLPRLNGEHGYRTFNYCFDQSETWSVYANHRYTLILLVEKPCPGVLAQWGGGGVTSGGVKSPRLGGKVFWGNMTMGLPFFLDKSIFVYINIFREKHAGVELLISRKLKPYTISLSCHLHWQLSLVTSFTWTNFLIWYVSSPFWVFFITSDWNLSRWIFYYFLGAWVFASCWGYYVNFFVLWLSDIYMTCVSGEQKKDSADFDVFLR